MQFCYATAKSFVLVLHQTIMHVRLLLYNCTLWSLWTCRSYASTSCQAATTTTTTAIHPYVRRFRPTTSILHVLYLYHHTAPRLCLSRPGHLVRNKSQKGSNEHKTLTCAIIQPDQTMQALARWMELHTWLALLHCDLALLPFYKNTDGLMDHRISTSSTISRSHGCQQ
ncbi:hypothetical protein SEVIR_8G244032v4 [Setaria viridis]